MEPEPAEQKQFGLLNQIQGLAQVHSIIHERENTEKAQKVLDKVHDIILVLLNKFEQSLADDNFPF